MQKKYGRGGTEEARFSLYSTVKSHSWGLLFASNSQCLVEVLTTNYREYLGEGYVRGMEGLYSCVPPGMLTASKSQILKAQIS